jgi:ribosomal protein L11 methyltransferase
LSEPLIRLAPKVASLLAPGGTLILAGLLKDQSGRVVASYNAQNVGLTAAYPNDGWPVLVMRRRGRA